MGPLDTPQVAFLGLAERASLTLDLTPTLNVLGLRQIIPFNFFPTSLAGVLWILAIRNLKADLNLSFRVKSPAGEGFSTFNIRTDAVSPTGPLGPLVEADHVSVLLPREGWVVFPCELGTAAGWIVDRPGRYVVALIHVDGSEEVIGDFQIVLAEPPPLTPERIAAIKSDPHSAKAARADIGCRYCPSKLRVYTALERSPKIEREGYTWYEDIPDRFDCECGKTSLDLTSMKRNFFGVLGQFMRTDSGPISYVPRYEVSALNGLRIESLRLLDSNPPEEKIQKFIERNPVLLHQFPAQQLFFKPPILTFFKADFAIVTPQKELILIEIETTQTKLLKKDGGVAAPLHHAFDQVRNWLHTVDEHRAAVLASLGIKSDMVSKVRGVVIAGRDHGYEEKHLSHLKWIDHGRVTFLTFDDLASSLGTLAVRMRAM